MKKPKILTVKQIVSQNSVDDIKLSKVEKYENYISAVMERVDYLHSVIMEKKLEFAQFIYESVEIGSRLFNKTRQKVFKDILLAIPGLNYSLRYPTFYRYYLTYKFIMEVKEYDRFTYDRLMIKLKNGSTKWNHINLICRSSLDSESKMHYAKQHVENHPDLRTSSGIMRSMATDSKYKSLMYSNLWEDNNILKNFEFRYIKENEKFFLPFGSDGKPGKKCFQPDESIAKTFIHSGFTKDRYTPEEDEKYNGVLIHPPQYNFSKREIRQNYESMGLEEYHKSGEKNMNSFYQYETFDVSSIIDFAERMEYVIGEAYRVVKTNGHIAVVGWNVPVWGSTRRGMGFLNNNEDINNDIRIMLEKHGEWEDTIIVPISKKVRRYFSTCAYRTIHIFRKI